MGTLVWNVEGASLDLDDDDVIGDALDDDLDFDEDEDPEPDEEEDETMNMALNETEKADFLPLPVLVEAAGACPLIGNVDPTPDGPLTIPTLNYPASDPLEKRESSVYPVL